MRVGRVLSIHRFPVKSMAGEQLVAADVGPDGLAGDRAFALRDDRVGEIRGAKKWPRLMQCSARYLAEPAGDPLPPVAITLPDGSTTGTDDLAVSRRLTELIGVPVTLCPRAPASDRDHYRRAVPGASVAGVLARSRTLRKVVSRLALLGPAGEELREAFGREAGETLPDLSAFPAELFAFVSPPGTYFDAFPIHFITTASLDALRARYPAADWDARRFRANFVVQTGPEVTGTAELGWGGRVIGVGALRLECTTPAPRCSMVTRAQPGVEPDPAVLRAIVHEPGQSVGMYARVLRGGRVSEGDEVELE